VTSEALALAALGATGLVMGYWMLQVLQAEGGAEGRCRRSVAGASEMAAWHGSGSARRARCSVFPAIVSFLNPQPALSLVGGNRP
jgi:hypothetical protein